jgi:hydroxymethylglutaryl-CoA reductase (NADPH)
MITKATGRICEYICAHYPVERYVIESNLAADKKSTPMNMALGRGKSVTAEVLIPGQFVKKYLHTSPESIVEAYNAQMLGNVYGGLIGCNYHFANGLAAIFLACGQDIANVMESANGLTSFRMIGKDLYASVALPSLIIGTIGGGTALATQKECLSIMGCYGSNKVMKFAEIIAVTVLAGEISLAGSMAANDFATAHEKYGRNYPVNNS